MQEMTEPDTPAITEKKRPLPILVLILASLTAFAPLSIDMYLPSFPQIAERFNVTEARVQLSLATFFIGLALGQLLYGTVTDRFGRKIPLYVGLIVYCLASIICALSPSVDALIISRFFQALGACGGIVIARATVRDLFDHRESARVFSLLMVVMGVAPILAPLIGGYVALFFGWRFIFLIVSGFSLLCLWAVIVYLPETKMPNPDVQLSRTFQTYWRLFKNKEFLGFTLTVGFAQAGMFAYITGAPFVFIELFHIPAESFGWIFGSNALGLIIFSQMNGRLLKTNSPTSILRGCLFLTVICSLALIVAGILNFGFWGVAVPLFLYIAILGMILPNATAGALSKQSTMAGTASALIGILQYTSAAISSALVSYFNNGTTLPMTALIGCCGILAFLVFRFLVVAADKKLETVTEIN